MPTHRVYDDAGEHLNQPQVEVEATSAAEQTSGAPPSENTEMLRTDEDAELLRAVRVTTVALREADERIETLRVAQAEAMRRARERFTLAEVGKAAGVSREWVRRLTQ